MKIRRHGVKWSRRIVTTTKGLYFGPFPALHAFPVATLSRSSLIYFLDIEVDSVFLLNIHALFAGVCR